MNIRNICFQKKLTILTTAGMILLPTIFCGCGHGPEQMTQPGTFGETGTYLSEDHRAEQDFDQFCMEVFRREMNEAGTLDLHYTLLHPEAYGIEHGNITLGTCRLPDMIANKTELKNLKSETLTYDRSALSRDQQLIYDALLETLDAQLMSEGLELYEQPLAPTIGVQAQLPILLAEYPFHSLEDVDTYLCLVEQIDTYYQEILIFEQQKADAGLAPSDATIDAVIESCEGYLPDGFSSDGSSPGSPPSDGSLSEYFLTSTFLERLQELNIHTPLTEHQRQNFISRHEQAISEHVFPAYELLIDGMNELRGRGLHNGGLAGYQNGKEYYEYLVRSGPGLSYSIPELKTALTNMMEQNLNAMNRLYLTYPDLSERIANASFSLTEPTEILEDLKQNMIHDFPVLPACDYDICYVPPTLQSVLSPAFYLTAPIDDINRNVIYINPAYTDSSCDLYTTLAHEGFPGHLYQTIYSRSQQREQPILSLLTCSGANEGWATYVEHLAWTFDNGLPEGVGEYYAQLRSYSLCVHGLLDIGIHYDGWSREAADAFVSSCFQVDEETLEQLWQTIIDNPANYLDYCGGFVEIMEMRAYFEESLGDAFSLMNFHKTLLDIGPLPFSVIRNHIMPS